MAQTAQSFP